VTPNQTRKGIAIAIGYERAEQLAVGTFAARTGENDPPEGGHQTVGWTGRHQENSKPRVRLVIAFKLPGARK
jgi:hypothetical protein